MNSIGKVMFSAGYSTRPIKFGEDKSTTISQTSSSSSSSSSSSEKGNTKDDKQEAPLLEGEKEAKEAAQRSRDLLF